jgi:hypothetical protein
MIRERSPLPIAAGLLAAAALLGMSGGPARAGNACSGSYMTSVMQEIPRPVKVSFAQSQDNKAQDLGKSFIDGMVGAGAVADPASPLRLAVVFTISTPASGPQRGKVYNNFNWVDEKGALVDTTGSMVNLTAQVMNIDTYSYVWIASAQCKVNVSDPGAVAADIGALIGRTLGRGVANGKF